MRVTAVLPAVPGLSTTHVLSRPPSSQILHSASDSQARRFLLQAIGHRHQHSRYTLDKFKEFVEYSGGVSGWRIVAVLGTSPALGLLCAVLLACIPLQTPSSGIYQNPGFVCHMTVALWLATMCAILNIREANQYLAEHYSVGKAVLISINVVVCTMGCVIVFADSSRFFPVPFTLTLAFAPWCVVTGLTHAVIFRTRLRQSAELRRLFTSAMRSMIIQSSQIVLYPAYAALFLAVREIYQLILVIAFPVVKITFRRLLRAIGTSFKEGREVMAVSSVEISASLCQSMIMQTTPSTMSSAIIIGVDIVVGLAEIKLFVDKKAGVLRRDLVARAMEIVTVYRVNEVALYHHTDLPPKQEHTPMPMEMRSISWGDVDVLVQSLACLQAAERILLIEYLEVIIPVVNAVYLIIASRLPSAVYNPQLRIFYNETDAVWTGLFHLMIYSVLQCLSIAVMGLVMRYRYQLHAASHLAFILEKHWLGLQCNWVGFVPFFLHFWLTHYGVDFSFAFMRPRNA